LGQSVPSAGVKQSFFPLPTPSPLRPSPCVSTTVRQSYQSDGGTILPTADPLLSSLQLISQVGQSSPHISGLDTAGYSPNCTTYKVTLTPFNECFDYSRRCLRQGYQPDGGTGKVIVSYLEIGYADYSTSTVNPPARRRVFRLRSEMPSSSLQIWWRHNLSRRFSAELQVQLSWHPEKSEELNYTASLAWNHAKPSWFTKGGQLSNQQPPFSSPTPKKIISCFILELSDLHERLIFICSLNTYTSKIAH